MEFGEVIDKIADSIYGFLGYKVQNNKGKVNSILYQNEDELKKAAQIEFLRSTESGNTKTYENIIDLMAEEMYDFANGKNTTLEDIKTYFKPLIESSVAIDKYINQSAKEIMDDYPEDGSTQDKIDFFIGLKERKKLVESKLTAVNNVLQQIQPDLIGWIESNPTTTLVGSNGKKAGIRTSMYPKVISLQELKKSLAENWAQFEGYNTKALGDLIRGLRDRAKQEGVDIHDLLPPGLDVSIVKSLTVSAGTSNKVRERQDGLDDLIDLITGKGDSNE